LNNSEQNSKASISTIWTSTTVKLDEDLVNVMLACNGIAKIQIGGVDGFYIFMPGEFDEDPRKVIAAYKKQAEEIEAGFARVEKEKRLANLNGFQKELDSQQQEGVTDGFDPISYDDMPALGGLDDGWTMVEDLGSND
jgi:hypothetical protein